MEKSTREKNAVLLGTRISATLHRQLKDIAEVHDWTLSVTVRKALRQYVAKEHIDSKAVAAA